MPSQFYPVDMIAGCQTDPVFVNVLLCLFRRADIADFPYEIVAYKFDDDKATDQFQRRFAELCPPTPAARGGLAKKPSALPARNRATPRAGGLMPGRPTHGVMGAVTADRWAARDRATPRLFASRSLDDLLQDDRTVSRGHHLGRSTDQLDRLSDSSDDQHAFTDVGYTRSFTLCSLDVIFIIKTLVHEYNSTNSNLTISRIRILLILIFFQFMNFN